MEKFKSKWEKGITIMLEKNADEPIILAAKDLQKDLMILSGQTEGVLIAQDGIETDNSCPAKIRIVNFAGKSQSFTEVEKELKGYAGLHTEHVVWETEAYMVQVQDGQVIIAGYDTLGTVFGIYAFSGKVLGVNPMYRMNDLLPKRNEQFYIEDTCFFSEPHKIRFRGWFLNDEDLLSDFKEDHGQRNIDYRFYQNVMKPDVLDTILETALRLEINLIIPSSFVDIANPAEEELIKAVCRRGLYISQHHVEPMGVSYFAADAYMKKHGTEGEVVSFIQNRTRMEEIWRYYAEKWAAYKDHVIWQFGLRGKADQAVWKTDSSISIRPEDRGRILTDAIATQYRIVSETLNGEEFFSTATLWMEGAELYGLDCLKIPEKTIVIFSDIGCTQMFGDDFYRVKRKPDRKYGIYYHVGFWGEGPHLAEGCDLRKMEFSYKKAVEYDSLYYSILNVSNLRPLHFSAWVNAEILKNPEGFEQEKIVQRVLQANFGESAIAAEKLYKEYYSAIWDMGIEEELKLCKKHGFYYHDYGKIPYPEYPATDGVLRRIGLSSLKEMFYIENVEEKIPRLKESEKRFAQLLKEMDEAEAFMAPETVDYLSKFLKLQTSYMLQLTRWCLACHEYMSNGQTIKSAQDAIGCLETILEERKVLEQGYWQGWHVGDKKMDIGDLLERTRRVTGL